MSNGYRRGSVFGALILIGIGGLFLYANLHPEFSAWPVLAKFWPVLIIFWGLGKLVDYLMLRGTPEGAAASRLTGGDIFGLILLLLFGSAISQAVSSGWWADRGIMIGDEDFGCLLGKEYEFSDEASLPATTPGSVAVSHTRGSVTIRSGLPGSALRVVARKSVCAASDAEAARLSQAFEPALEAAGDGYEFRWNLQAGETRAVRANLDLQVPQGMTGVNLSVEHGDVEVQNVTGDVSIEIRHGDVDVTGIGGDVEIEGRGGEVRVRNVKGSARVEGTYYGPIELAAIGGTIQYDSSRTTFHTDRLPGELRMESGELTLRDAPGDVSLVTRDYEMSVEDVGGALSIENRNGRVAIRAPRAPTQPIEVTNRSGSIELTLPAGSGFTITASSRNGDIESDFTGGTLALEEEHGDATLEGTFGNGRAPIQLSTTHGTIYLRQSRLAPPAPPAPAAPQAPAAPAAPPAAPSTRD